MTWPAAYRGGAQAKSYSAGNPLPERQPTRRGTGRSSYRRIQPMYIDAPSRIPGVKSNALASPAAIKGAARSISRRYMIPIEVAQALIIGKSDFKLGDPIPGRDAFIGLRMPKGWSFQGRCGRTSGTITGGRAFSNAAHTCPSWSYLGSNPGTYLQFLPAPGYPYARNTYVLYKTDNPAPGHWWTVKEETWSKPAYDTSVPERVNDDAFVIGDIWLNPRLDPMAQPIGAGNPFANSRVRRQHSKLSRALQRGRAERASSGNAVPAVGRARSQSQHGRVPPPMSYSTSGNRLTRRPPTGRKPPDRGRTKERKAAATGKFGVALAWAMAGTEALDFIDAFHSALPHGKKNGVRPQHQLRDLWNHWDEVDLAEAAFNLVYNHFEDKAVGALSRAASDVLVDATGRRSLGFTGGNTPEINPIDIEVFTYGS